MEEPGHFNKLIKCEPLLSYPNHMLFRHPFESQSVEMNDPCVILSRSRSLLDDPGPCPPGIFKNGKTIFFWGATGRSVSSILFSQTPFRLRNFRYCIFSEI